MLPEQNSRSGEDSVTPEFPNTVAMPGAAAAPAATGVPCAVAETGGNAGDDGGGSDEASDESLGAMDEGDTGEDDTDSGDEDLPEARRLLIIEDDEAFARTLARSFERRGYDVATAPNADAAAALLEEHDPRFAVVDLKLEGNSSGLACVQLLHQHNPDMLIVVLTGFASIGTAVEAIKLGACQYLAKPSNTDDIEAAFGHVAGNTDVELTNRATSLKTLEWERIHETLAETNFNISEAARRLGMHRRTLARKLEKHRVK